MEWRYLAVALIAAFLIVLLLRDRLSPGESSFVREQELIVNALVVPSRNMDNGVALVIEEKVDRERLERLAGMGYEELKSQIGVGKDFALYFTDDDGQLIEFDGQRTCIGSPKAVVGGSRCS
ncbi:hypothetical protein HYY74_01265 [Candidatus Woesearchaeota archaeon]|nr:hypothetical protein [Candidatus Woesearchaeota archaeon]